MLHSIKKQAGFTLVELLVVLTVFGILTLAVFTIFINQFIFINFNYYVIPIYHTV